MGTTTEPPFVHDCNYVRNLLSRLDKGILLNNFGGIECFYVQS
uniref:Chemokine n=1 Tax=Siphoviridae sp. ctekV29 TaxID=2826406 RepID=A0A8S5QNM2_9CAUD|nr:MAG TPA: chemokine [Siphoviridae sp. ctekV29]